MNIPPIGGVEGKVIKVGLWGTIRNAYSFVFSNILGLLRIFSPWIIGTIVVLGITALMLVIFRAAAVAFGPKISLMLFGAAPVIFLFAGMMAGQVALYRFILKGEAPYSFWRIRFGRRELRFSLYFFGIWLAILLPPVIVAAILYGAGRFFIPEQFNPIAAPTAAAVLSICAILTLFFGFRLFLALPAIAIDEKGCRLFDAWRQGRNNTQVLFFGPVIAGILLRSSTRSLRHLLEKTTCWLDSLK